MDAIFAKIATLFQPTTKPTTAASTTKKSENKKTDFYTLKPGSIAPLTQSPVSQSEEGRITNAKDATNQITAPIKTMYPEAESNKTTTPSIVNTQKQEAPTTQKATTTARTVETTKRPVITKPTEFEIVPPVCIKS